MRRYLSIGCFTALFSCAANAASFEGLGDLPGGGVFGAAYGVSANGQVTVGEAMSDSGTEAVRYTKSGGLIGLGDLEGGQFLSFARGVSNNGETIVGLASSGSGFEAFRWTTVEGMVGLGDLAGGDFDSQGVGVSADGTTVVGHSAGASGREAFRWSAADGMVGLGDLPGGLFSSYANGVSADGTVVVGFSTGSSGQEAFRWTVSGGMTGLGDLPGGSSSSLATDVSADGNVVVGYGNSTRGAEAIRWTAGGGMMPLGDLDGGQFQSSANAVSADGNVIVGQATTANGFEAFIWTEADGMRNLRELLLAAGVSGLDLWSLTTALDISPDGKWVVGRGINSAGETEGYLANISLPTFSDVPPDYWAFSFIETLAASGITAGCGNNNYCPEVLVSRAQMAVFLERGMNGSDFIPPAASGNAFLDVGAGDFAANFIEQLFNDGITAGCGNNNYCPGAEVSRAQMAVFLLRAKYGSSYSPPAATGVFNDVDLGYWAVHWIEALAAEGITAGCGNGNYCPEAPVTRAQMAVFLVRTFAL